MNRQARYTPRVRFILLCSFIVLFLFIGGIFVYQYRQYRALEKRLSAAYLDRRAGSDHLNQLFALYGETENTFRLYTLDFSDHSYQAYFDNVTRLRTLIDTLGTLPIHGNPLIERPVDVSGRERLALEFASLKRKADELVFHTSDSLRLLHKSLSILLPNQTRTRPVIEETVRDTVRQQTVKDTIVRKKPGLIKRIFDSRDDTIVVAASVQEVERERLQLLHQQLDSAQHNLAESYYRNLDQLRGTFQELRSKERQLVVANLELLNRLKESVNRLRSMDNELLRLAEENDIALYKSNIGVFGKQFVFALLLMLVMLIALIYYQIYATSYERRLREEKDYAAQLAEEKTSVLANISHEIRTPLNSLLGIIDLLRNRTRTGEADEKLIDSAYYNINIISNSISDILSLSKLEAANKGSITLEYFSPNRTFHDLVALHRNQAELKNLELRTEINVDPYLQVMSNELRIKQVASNFLSNAIKYTHKGHITFRAGITQNGGRSVLHVEVEDTGLGIKEQDQRKIFRKYFTATPNSGGVGLGLYISKIMIHELGGTIGVKSKPGVGSVFYTDIPITEHRVVDVVEHHFTLSDLPVSLRLLVVDDNPINILLIKQFFRNFNNVQTVNSGEDALEALNRHTFDLVITDINMPGISGVELLTKIRGSARLREVKVLAISADMSTLQYAGEQQPDTSFDGFIEKPFTEQEVVRTILRALGDRRAAALHEDFGQKTS